MQTFPVMAVVLLLLCACTPITEHVPAVIPTRPMVLTATPPTLSQNWTARTALTVGNPQGAWLRSEPDSGSTYPGMPIIGYGTVVRVIGKPFYETVPGQWWWLVSAESGDIGWMEESSLTVIITVPSR